MARRCEVCGKGPMVGNNVSHAHNTTKRRWLPNLQHIRVATNGGKTVQRMKVCTQCIKSGKVVRVNSRA